MCHLGGEKLLLRSGFHPCDHLSELGERFERVDLDLVDLLPGHVAGDKLPDHLAIHHSRIGPSLPPPTFSGLHTSLHRRQASHASLGRPP